MRFIWRRWLPLLLWMAFIFIVSADPNPYNSVNADLGREVSPKAQNAQQVMPVFSNDVLGEISHLAEYIVLGFLAVWAVAPGRSPRAIAGLALGICLLYAFSDEIHQIFVPGRAFQLADLALDAAGNAVGALLGIQIITRRASMKCHH